MFAFGLVPKSSSLANLRLHILYFLGIHLIFIYQKLHHFQFRGIMDGSKQFNRAAIFVEKIKEASGVTSSPESVG